MLVADVPCGPALCGAHHRVRCDIGAPYALDPFFLHVRWFAVFDWIIVMLC